MDSLFLAYASACEGEFTQPPGTLEAAAATIAQEISETGNTSYNLYDYGITDNITPEELEFLERKIKEYSFNSITLY